MSGPRVVPQVSWVSWRIRDAFLPGRGLVVVLHCRQQSGRSPYVNRHMTGTGLGLVTRPCVHRSQKWAGSGRAGGGTIGPVAEQGGLGFGGVLRGLPQDAGVTQKEV